MTRASASSIPELEELLRAARVREELAIRALAPKHKGGEVEEYRAASGAVLACERALSAAKGEPHAVPLDFPVQWDTGAPLPHLIQNDYQTFLAFRIREVDPIWDGSYTNVRSAADAGKLALVEFKQCMSTKMGSPNDEVFSGHPLYGKGFEPYAALRVENSSWIRELESINSVHAQYRPDAWKILKHYVLGFHDSTFECVAEGFSVETHSMRLSQLLVKICERLG